jgi:hypothetical protein
MWTRESSITSLFVDAQTLIDWLVIWGKKLTNHVFGCCRRKVTTFGRIQ